MNVSSLHVCLFQANIRWKAVKENLMHYEQCLEQIADKPDLLIFPEMFNTGFAVDTIQLAETIDGESVGFLRYCAKKYRTAVTASLALKENGKFYNSLLWIMPDGEIYRYDKRHLFRMASEEHLFSQGQERLLVNYKGWIFLPLICYDLRFPIWSRNVRKSNEFLYDCLLYIANWPSSRMQVFKTLLSARAIENQSYAIGVNRVGEDGNGLLYSGNSQVINPFGIIMSEAASKEEIISVTLNKEDLVKYRMQFPVSLDWDV
jgi:predicted amidohydrolase